MNEDQIHHDDLYQLSFLYSESDETLRGDFI